MLKHKIKIWMFNKQWRKKNKDNFTTANNTFSIRNVTVGKKTYGPLNIKWYPSATDAKLLIGSYCSIAEKVQFIMGGEHDYKRLSTWPFQSKVYHQQGKQAIDRDIYIEDDVWIGYDTLILSGAHIGQGSVIAARSVVSGNIPPYSVYVGNKIIKYRFSEEIIEKLLKINYQAIEHEKDDEYSRYCQDHIDAGNIDLIIDAFVGDKK